MCGIAGVYRCGGIQKPDVAVVEKMNRIQAHRGPNDQGLFEGGACVLGHRRLAIIDLSRDGHQPFVSSDGRYVLVYNGEIYNYIELRADLKSYGWTFRTKTDTEVLLNAYRHFGPRCLTKFNGMFAFAVYDTKQQTLFLARDRFGIKPLYYSTQQGMLAFASEIKSLHAALRRNWTLNRQSLFDYLVFNRTDIFDETFIAEIKRLPKGHWALLDGERITLRQWWHPMDYAADDNAPAPADAARRLEQLLISAVKLRMRSDVTVGSCLSGGLDSSILTGILFEHCDPGERYATFTAAFPGHPIDETEYIDALNRKYPFANFRTFPTAETARRRLAQFVYANDEPTTMASFYSQYEVMREAQRQGVTVLLDGQGGDENFAGYQYFHGFNMYGMLRRCQLTDFCRELIRSKVRRQHVSAYQTLLFQLLPDRMKKELLYRSTGIVQRDFFNAGIDNSRIYREFFVVDGLNQSLVRHFQYKLEHLLRMEDRNSMAFSLEARVPYLDYRLVQFMLAMPAAAKIKNGETKWMQKAAFSQYTVPEILTRKDKIGFGTPSDDWMRHGAWRRLTTAMHGELVRSWPEVFVAAHSAAGGMDPWKITQLGVWKTLFFPK